jgi:hypothetical protein
MRAIRRTIDGVTYDTGSADLVHRVWTVDDAEDAEVELSLYRSEEGHWFEVRREEGQLYGGLKALSPGEAVQWRRIHGAEEATQSRGAVTVGEASAALLTRPWAVPDPVNG